MSAFKKTREMDLVEIWHSDLWADDVVPDGEWDIIVERTKRLLAAMGGEEKRIGDLRFRIYNPLGTATGRGWEKMLPVLRGFKELCPGGGIEVWASDTVMDVEVEKEALMEFAESMGGG
jgi:hypothetical protein